MGNLHLITGHAGEPHVTAADHGSLHAAIFGGGQYVLNRGSKFATTTISNNSIRVADGDLLMQGRHIRLNEGTYVDLTIENGTQGTFRNDLIVARYTKDSLSGVEDCSLVVVKGTATTGTPADPEYTEGDIINDHVLLADMPLYRVPLNGLNVQTLVALYSEPEFLRDGSVGSSKIAQNAVTENKINSGAVTSSKISSGAVTNEKISNGAVTKEKIEAGATYTVTTATLSASGWSGNAQTVYVSGVTANNAVIVSPDPASFVAYGESQVRCTAQASGTLTFTCEATPSVALSVNVLIPV